MLFSLNIVLAIFSAFFMAWGVGANDVANAMGTSVGSKALTIKQAIIIATIFETVGALFASHEVTFTIKRLIIYNPLLHNNHDLIYGMLASLLASGSWLIIASHYSWPVSTTHSIVGAVVGFGAICLGLNHLNWQLVMNIGLSWLLTPFLSCLIAYFIFISLQKIIFDHPEPLKQAHRHLPIYAFFTIFTISLIFSFSCCTKQPIFHKLVIAGILSSLASLVSLVLLKKSACHVNQEQSISSQIEKSFSILTTLTACTMAFAHGSNDVANATGPLAAIVQTVTGSHHMPLWIPILGASGIVLGLAMYGHKVIATIGKKITYLTPTRSFAAQLATAITIILSSSIGLPVSTTQILVGAIMGVGMARGIVALNLHMIRLIFISWIITLPAGALLAIGFFYLLKFTLG